MERYDNNSIGIASLVLGIISIVTFLFWYITLPCGILAIVFGVKSNRITGGKLRKSRISNWDCWFITVCLHLHKSNTYTTISCITKIKMGGFYIRPFLYFSCFYYMSLFVVICTGYKCYLSFSVCHLACTLKLIWIYYIFIINSICNCFAT